jgi:hypothetical protein
MNYRNIITKERGNRGRRRIDRAMFEPPTMHTLPSQQLQKFVSRYFCLFENVAHRSRWNVASVLSYNGPPRRVILVP